MKSATGIAGSRRFCVYAALLLMTAGSHARDAILYNGNILTVDASFTIAEAVAIEDGRILQVGSNREIRQLATDSTELIDLAGNTVTPGFIDTHPHMIHAGSGAAAVVLADVKSVADIKQKIAIRVANTPPGECVAGFAARAALADPIRPRRSGAGSPGLHTDTLGRAQAGDTEQPGAGINGY